MIMRIIKKDATIGVAGSLNHLESDISRLRFRSSDETAAPLP